MQQNPEKGSRRHREKHLECKQVTEGKCIRPLPTKEKQKERHRQTSAAGPKQDGLPLRKFARLQLLAVGWEIGNLNVMTHVREMVDYFAAVTGAGLSLSHAALTAGSASGALRLI